MAGYVYSGPGYASDLASGKVSLNTSLPNASDYAKYVSAGSSPSSAKVISSPTASPSRVSNDDYEDLREIASMAHNYDIEAQEFSAEEAAKNRKWNSDEAALAREFNKAEAEAARVFSASEAEKTRAWQEKMSKNSHQYEIQDLIAAGLNPVLSAKLGGATPYSGVMASGVSASSGGGASSGSTGQSSNTAGSLLGTLFSAIINSATTMAKTSVERMNLLDELENRVNVAHISGDYSLGSADIYSSANLASAKMSSEATRYASDQSSGATKYASDQSSAASKYGSTMSHASAVYSANKSSDTQKLIAGLESDLELYVKQNYPSSLWGTIMASGNMLSQSIFYETSMSGASAYNYIKNRIDSMYGDVKNTSSRNSSSSTSYKNSSSSTSYRDVLPNIHR